MNIALLIVGLIGGIYFYSDISKGNETKDWKATYATLDKFETHSYWRNKNNTEKECKKISARYSYLYNNKNYSNTTISLVPQSQIWAHQVDELVSKKKWKKDAKIIVYINPEQPKESVMLRGTTEVGTDTWIAFSFCLLLFTSGLVGCIRSLYKLFTEPLEIESSNEIQ